MTKPKATPCKSDKLSIDDQRRLMADAGDVDGIWKLLTETRRSLLDLEATFRSLLRAIEVAANRDPASFSADVFAKMAGFTSYLLFRSHYYCSRLLASDRGPLGPGAEWFPRDVSEVVLPQLIQLQLHLGELLHLQASTTRLWELARQRQFENDKVQGKAMSPIPLMLKKRSKRRQHQPGKKAALPPVNRVSGYLAEVDGISQQENGYHADN